jgi:hypothetical protein
MNLKRFNPLIVGRGRYGWSQLNDVEGQGKVAGTPGQAWGCFLCGKVVDRRSRSSHVPFLLLSRAPREKRQSFFGRFVKQEDSSSSRLEKHIREYNRVTAISSPFEQEPG